jgi:hypothetical protein
MWQWAARYGKNKNIDVSLIRSLWDQKVGLGYLNYIENWNEPNKWWEGNDGNFSPVEFAAMTSADYDGHESTLGKTFGVKNADPTMKFVMGGLAGPHVDLVKAMHMWAQANRSDKQFPADVLNYHHYATDLHSNPIQGISPEAADFPRILQRLVDYRNYYLPNKEVWLSEFGWDVREGESRQVANGHTKYGYIGYTSEDLQAMWLVRGFLIGAKVGLDRMHMYTTKDASSSNGLYASSGLIDAEGNKRKSYFYVSTMKQRLKGMVFVGEQASNNDNVWIYKFKSADGKGVYVLWAPTSDATEVKGYKLQMNVNPGVARLVTLANRNEAGQESSLTVVSNSVTVDVSEKPIFIMVDNIDGTIPSSSTARASVSEEGISKVHKKNVLAEVSPNPASNYINISLGSNNNTGSVEIVDFSGRRQLIKSLSPGNNLIDVGSIRKGMYILEVKSGALRQKSRIVIE